MVATTLCDSTLWVTLPEVVEVPVVGVLTGGGALSVAEVLPPVTELPQPLSLLQPVGR